MKKVEIYQKKLIELFDEYFSTSDCKQLEAYLIDNSNLPGPRGNLELANAFADVVQKFSQHDFDMLWQLSSRLVEISANEAPTNDPKEFLSFCGTVAIGSLASIQQNRFEKSMIILKKIANDSRWRLREAVCLALQRLMNANYKITLDELEKWIRNGTLLELRAVAAAVADPPLLKNESIAMRSLQFHKSIIGQFLRNQDRKTEPSRILRQALGFAISVVVRSVPKEGFEFLRQLVGSSDKDVLWIARENLKKNRLLKNFPEDVALLRKQLDSI